MRRAPTKIGSTHATPGHGETGFDSKETRGDVQNQRVLSLDRV